MACRGGSVSQLGESVENESSAEEQILKIMMNDVQRNRTKLAVTSSLNMK